MIYLLSITSILLAFISFMYLQLHLFIPDLPFIWLNNYKWKRMSIRILALICFFNLLHLNPPLWISIITGIPFSILWLLSFIFSSTNIFQALGEKHIVKSNGTSLADSNEVVGFVDDEGNAICYPIVSLLSPRHMLDDVFWNNKIMLTYCPACGSCMIFSREVKNMELNFEVAAGLYRRNMLMRDVQTRSIWQQSTGEAIYGKLKGTKLKLLSYQQMTIKEWTILYPQTLFASASGESPKGIFSQKQLVEILPKVSGLEGRSKSRVPELAFNEKVWGIEVNGFSKAYPISELKNTDTIIDRLGDTEVEIFYNAQNNLINGKEIKTGKKLVFQSHWWIGWKEFHHNTLVWKSK